ncbi:MAG: NAD-binding protein [Candidatus Micrarchaeia archaeon]
MLLKSSELKEHVIICGYGIVGQKISDILLEHNIPFIIIDTNPKIIERAKELGIKAIEGDATSSKVLSAASIEDAKAIAIVMDNDAKNLLSTLTARDLNKNIFIASRASNEFLRNKLIEGGANYVVMTNKAASREILKELLSSKQ